MPRCRSLTLLALACLHLTCGAQSQILGNLDHGTGTYAFGWAYNPDLGYNPIRVRLFDGSRFVGEGLANVLRPDLPSWFQGKNHGFHFPIKPLSPGAHSLSAWAVKEDGRISYLRAITVTSSFASPGGHVETATVEGDRLVVTGWAYDEEAGAGPISVHVYVNGSFAGIAVANRPRPDLTVGLGSPNHGFRIELPHPGNGVHSLDVYGINVGPTGNNRRLDSFVPMELDLREDLAPAGARDATTNTARYSPQDATFRWTWDDGTEQREYVVNPAAFDVSRGLITIAETISGSFPAYRGGTLRRRLNGAVAWPGGLLFDSAHEVVMAPPVFDGRSLVLRYEETLDGITLSKTVSYSLRGKTLVVDVEADGGLRPGAGGYYGLFPGHDVMLDGRSIHLPYMMTPVHVGRNVAVSRYVDVCFSNANDQMMLGPEAVTWGVGGFWHDVLPLYRQDGTGRVNPLRERLYVTASGSLDATFMTSSVRPSPYRADAGTRVIYDTWGVDRLPPGRDLWSIPFQEQKTHFTTLRQAYGLEQMSVIRHNWGSDYDFSLPQMIPANPLAGGDTALQDLVQTMTVQGWRFSLHENHSSMFGPNPFVANPEWYDPTKIARWQNGDFKTHGFLVGAGQQIFAFAVLPQEQVTFATWHSEYVRTHYPVNAGFWDVQLYLPPPMDLSGAQTDIATFGDGIRSIKSGALVIRNAYQGPLSGEGYARSMDWTLPYAGYCDGVERELVGGEDGLVIPDFELRCVQPLMANQGMGYYGRFFGTEKRQVNAFPTDADHDFIRSRSIAYGHTGFISDTLAAGPKYINLFPLGSKTFRLDQIVKEYYVLQALQSRALDGPVLSVTYDDGGIPKSLGTKLRELATSTTDQAAFDAAVRSFFYSPRLRIQYENGLLLFVNCHRQNDWQVVMDGTLYTLPPSGFAARRTLGGDAFLAYTARVPGSLDVTTVVEAPEYHFVDNRSQRLVTVTGGLVPIFMPY
jgi:hypothetical protein